MAYVNSWNMSLVEINGVDFTNVWSNNMPAAIDGKWYIHYVGSYSWSHFEAPALKDADELFVVDEQSEISVYPNPVNEFLTIENIQDYKFIRMFDLNAKIIYQTENNLTTHIIDVKTFDKGLYIISLSNEDTDFRKLITIY